MTEEFEEASVHHVDNCKEGHCGCFYSNQNLCCRCGKVQIDRTLIHRRVKYGDSRDGVQPERAPMSRDGNKQAGHIVWQ